MIEIKITVKNSDVFHQVFEDDEFLHNRHNAYMRRIRDPLIFNEVFSDKNVLQINRPWHYAVMNDGRILSARYIDKENDCGKKRRKRDRYG